MSLSGDMMPNISVLGMGLSCIDVVKCGETTEYSPGGTAANVMCVLAQLGVNTALLVPRYGDKYAEYLVEELKRRGVEVIEFRSSGIPTPRIIERCGANGEHQFETVCPECGAHLNRIILPVESDIKGIGDKYFDTNLIYFDRISTGIKKCISRGKKWGAWTYYEPNSCRQYKTFLNNIAKVDIVKFSADRVAEVYIERLKDDLDTETQTKLIIVSQGAKGLKFATKDGNGRFSQWVELNAAPLDTPLDTSGAGDWLTATFLWYFLKEFPKELRVLPQQKINSILMESQKMASLSCMYKGAQGFFKFKNSIVLLEEQFKCKIPRIILKELEDLELNECAYCRRKVEI